MKINGRAKESGVYSKIDTVSKEEFDKIQRISTTTEPSSVRTRRPSGHGIKSASDASHPEQTKSSKAKKGARFYPLKDAESAKMRRPAAVPDTRTYHNRVPVGWVLGYLLFDNFSALPHMYLTVFHSRQGQDLTATTALKARAQWARIHCLAVVLIASVVR